MDFTLKDLLQMMYKRMWWLILAAIIGSTLAYGYAKFLISPTYQSTAVFLFNYENKNNNTSPNADLTFAQNIMRNCVVLLKQNNFYNEITKDTDFSAGMLRNSCSYSIGSFSTDLTVTVRTNDPKLSYEIALLLSETIGDYITDYYPLTSNGEIVVKNVNTPTQSNTPVSSNETLYMIIGFIISVGITFGVLLLIEVLDVRIKDEESIIEKYNLPILGIVPYHIMTREVDTHNESSRN